MATVDSVARLLALGAKGSGGGGTGGTSNYPDLANKPQINGVELVGNKTSEDLGIEQGVTEEVLTQALAAETASREKQDELLQGEIDNKLSPYNIIAGDNVEITQDGGNVTINAQNSPIATLENAGIVKPDGETITVDAEGIIRAISGGEAVHVIRNNDEKPFILEDNEVGYYLLDLDTLGTTTVLPSHPRVFSYGASENNVQSATVRDETTFIFVKYHTDVRESQTTGNVPVLTIYSFDITQDSFPTIYMEEENCVYENGEYKLSPGPYQYFKIAGAEDLPKKLSELKNDTNFINQEELEELLSNKQDKIDGTVATAENLTLERVSENAKNLTLKVNGIEIGSIPAPQVQFNGATTFVAKEVKSFYEEIELVPETVDGSAWGSASDPAHGDINYLTEENGPYLVLTNINIENPTDLLGGNVIILKDILSTELPSSELLTIQFNGEDIGQYDGSEPKTINIQAATEEYVKQLVSTIQTASFEVVDSLPESDIKTNVIYLVPSQSSGIDNVYDEYIYVNNDWEKIGTTALDLSQYATKEYAEMAAANTINDAKISNLTTYSSSKIESLSGIKVLTGTAEKPIIVSELETGNYVLSGTVQSSETNTTTQALSKKVYTVEKGDSETVVWYENPKTHITYTYTFDTVGTNAPEEQDEIYITETQLKQAVIDGGNWA